MKYASTRTDNAELTFDEVVLAGLAPDGGLYLPNHLPEFSSTDLEAMRGLNYVQLASRIMLPFMGEDWDEARLMPLLEKSYANFRHEDIAPIQKLSDQHFVLELFHGPTLAFKDFALQFLGNLLEDILKRNQQKVTVIGATSGDTGSAAIAGLAGHDAINIHILYPDGRVSDVQRRQMTTVDAPNVFALAIDGTFDDCQAMVKAMFADKEFNQAHNLVAVNSINWARIMAQIVYYFYAALKLLSRRSASAKADGAPQKKLSFSVPTGNFGDIYAGWLAKHMGLPINKLIIATNSNDILARCWQHGSYEMKPLVQTLSPSMDIQISSNFERLLYGYFEENGQAIDELMATLKTENTFSLPDEVRAKLNDEFFAKSVDDEQTKQTIAEIYNNHNTLMDPHTATGVVAAEAWLEEHAGDTVVTLSTAHPAKFPDAVEDATGQHPELPVHMKNLFDLPERHTRLANNVEAVKAHIASK